MGEQEKDRAQPQAEAAEAKAAPVAAEKISDEDFASILSDSFGDFSGRWNRRKLRPSGK